MIGDWRGLVVTIWNVRKPAWGRLFPKAGQAGSLDAR
ncbi:MAG: hypothetical protein FD177_2300 [Desulfovibrionaceae bacterium]|nr:MAG: hypothetical protein FD177_2300 [Desulfovibrionaceae bacterium]